LFVIPTEVEGSHRVCAGAGESARIDRAHIAMRWFLSCTPMTARDPFDCARDDRRGRTGTEGGNEMGDRSNIEWTDATWNPVTGCTKVSDGCKNCYAEALVERFGKQKFTDVTLHPERLELPLRWKKPRRVFVNSMSDLFHEAVADEFIVSVFGAMFLADQHIYQVLTKRPERMRNFLLEADAWKEAPRKNIWLGVSVENQAAADERIPLLMQTPAAVRFLSVEPLLEAVDLRADLTRLWANGSLSWVSSLSWVIVGGESGAHRRECKVEWIADIVAQCEDAGIPCFVKQDSHRLPGQQGRIPDELWAVKELPRRLNVSP
jgi:protein gp37